MSNGAEMANEIDWTQFDYPVNQTLECSCGAIWRSHVKAVIRPDGNFIMVSRKPCLRCGNHTSIVRASSDPESATISR